MRAPAIAGFPDALSRLQLPSPSPTVLCEKIRNIFEFSIDRNARYIYYMSSLIRGMSLQGFKRAILTFQNFCELSTILFESTFEQTNGRNNFSRQFPKITREWRFLTFLVYRNECRVSYTDLCLSRSNLRPARRKARNEASVTGAWARDYTDTTGSRDSRVSGCNPLN